MKLRIPVIFGNLLLLGVAAAPAHAIDPPIVEGHLQYGNQRHELRYAQAVRSPDDPKRLWILLTTTGLSVKEAAEAPRVLERARSGALRGIRLNVAAAAPRTDELQGALLLDREESPGGEVVFAARGEALWERLSVGDKRIVGRLRYSKPGWAMDVSFSAPIFSAR